MSIQIMPSILSADFGNLHSECRKVIDGGADALHFDVMDGHFVKNISFGLPVLKSIHRLMPDVIYDVHLMISNPLEYVDAFAKAGATWLTFHCESNSPPKETIDAIHAAGMMAGISIKPSTPVQAVFPLLDKVELVLVMSVEPGFGGQQFIPDTIKKIGMLAKEAKAYDIQRLRIQVDGGINLQSAPLCSAAGATAFVAGSSIFGTPDYAKSISQLKKVCENA